MKQEVVVQVIARSFVNVLKHVDPCVFVYCLKRVYKRCRNIFARYFEEFRVIVMFREMRRNFEKQNYFSLLLD